MNPPFPTRGGGASDRTKLPTLPRSGSGSNGADGLRKVPQTSEVRSSGPKGGKPPSKGTSAGLPRRSSD